MSRLFSTARGIILSLAMAWSVIPGTMTSASAEIQNQWKPANKTLSDYVASGYVFEAILLDRITPVSVQAMVYFLRKDNLLVRCSETATRVSGVTTNLTIGCAELVKPATK